MINIIDSFIVRWYLKQRNTFFGVVMSCMLSCVFCQTNSTTTSAANLIQNVSLASSVLAMLIMITLCVWITAHVRQRSRGHNMTWSPPPINVHLHGMDSRALSRTPSHYRSHRTVSECDKDQPSAEDKSLKSGVHTYNVIENCVHGQANGDSTGILTTSLEDDGTRSNEIFGKISDPYPMIPNPLYRTRSCVMERRKPMPLPRRGHRSTDKDSRKVCHPQRSVTGTDKSELLETNTIALRALTSHGPLGNQPERPIQSIRSKSCDPLRYTDQPSKKEWCFLDSLDALDKLEGLDKPPFGDVFEHPDYSLIGNLSGRSRSYSLFHLPRKNSFDPSRNPASAVVPRRGRPGAFSSQGLNGATCVSASERYEMIQNPLCQAASYNLLDRPEKTRAREIETVDGHFKSSRSGTQCSQRNIDDEGYQTITDAGDEHCRVEQEYTDIK